MCDADRYTVEFIYLYYYPLIIYIISWIFEAPGTMCSLKVNSNRQQFALWQKLHLPSILIDSSHCGDQYTGVRDVYIKSGISLPCRMQVTEHL